MTVIGIISAKGGVGKTTISANLGIALVKALGKRVLVIDGNITTPTLGLQLGMLSQEKTLDDVLEDRDTLQDSTYIHPSGLHIVPASLSLRQPYPDPEKLKDKLVEVRDKYDFIIIDGAAGIGREVISVIEASDSVLVVSNPELSSVVAAIKAIKVSKSLNVPVIGLAINRVENKKYEMKAEDIKNLTESDIVSIIPFDKNIPAGVKQMEPAFLSKNSRSRRAFIELAEYVSGEEIPKQGFMQKLKSVFRH